jgi:hypothetical protein
MGAAGTARPSSPPAAGKLPAPGEPFEPAAGRFSGQAILYRVSYFSFRSNVARNRGENSCSTGQNWSRLAEIAPNLYQLRQTGSVQVFSAWAESLCSVGAAREVGVRRNDCCNVRLNPHLSHETKARRMGHPKNPMRASRWCGRVGRPPLI